MIILTTTRTTGTNNLLPAMGDTTLVKEIGSTPFVEKDLTIQPAARSVATADVAATNTADNIHGVL